MEGRPSGNDGRVEGRDGRVDGSDGRVEGNDGLVDGTEGRVDGNDGFVDGMDGRVDGNDGLVDGIDGRVDGNDGRVDGIDGRETDGIPVLGRVGRLKLGLGLLGVGLLGVGRLMLPRLTLARLMFARPPPPPPRPRACNSLIGVTSKAPASRNLDAVFIIGRISKCKSVRGGYARASFDHLADRVGGGGRFTIVIGSMFSRTLPATIMLRYCHVTISAS